MNYKKFYTEFLAAQQGVLHMTAHSHHFWPDITKVATLQYWNDSKKYVDDKWDYFFSEKIPQTQKLIAENLKLSNPEQIVFAPNTHEFIYRILSCFDLNQKIKILSTDSEFYSFDRQIKRLTEDSIVDLTVVSTKPYADFLDRLIEKINTNQYDLIFISHVFFNSGFVVADLNRLVAAIQNSKTMIVIDGYHGFMAVPTDLSGLQDRIFYLSGSYKYAQGGEGCCFLTVPKGCSYRPKYTGWFAGFGDLAGSKKDKNKISYSEDGMAFAGSTMDMTALYRLNSVLTLFKENNITVETIHQHVLHLQTVFLKQIENYHHDQICKKNLLSNDLKQHGHFLAFETNDVQKCAELSIELKKKNIRTDFRGSVIRFGFGLQHDLSDIEKLVF